MWKAKGFVKIINAFILTFVMCIGQVGFAESQVNDYPGVKDPFGDPSSYEFAEDEQSDKEFFHLGRFLMFGLDLGAGIFTGGLGKTANPGVYAGVNLVYFLDRALASEISAHYAYHLDDVRSDAGVGVIYNTDFIPINFGARYYIDTRSAPKAIAIANPYLAGGLGLYLRTLTPTSASAGYTPPSGGSTSFGLYIGAGIQFPIYQNHIYLGADFRYHFIFFSDASSTLNGLVPTGSRAGGYLTSLASISWNF